MRERILDREAELRAEAEKAGQGHLFAWWPGLNQAERACLLEQVASIDFARVESLVQGLIAHPARTEARTLEPAPILTIPRTNAERKAAQLARQRGEALLRDGKVAALVVAGGQGTRLGWSGPKGTFPIGPVSHKCLFAFFGERICAAQRRYGAAIPWYVMTSSANDEQIRAFFERKGFFGLDPNLVHFFIQGTMPAVDRDGKILLAARDEIALNPDGHGGTLRALERSGALERLEAQGIEEISYFQVDNVLAKVTDPVFIGHHAGTGAEMSTKVVRKAHPDEKVGVVGILNGRLGVVEYSDLSREEMVARGSDGQLKYWAGNIAIHMIQVAFVRRLQRSGIRLPFHRADKKVPFVDGKGRLVEPEAPNGVKFESFIFDALPYAARSVTQEVMRKEEFSPVKNAHGLDSPETAQRALMEVFASWLEDAGVRVPRRNDGALAARLEISPSFALDREEALQRIPPDLAITGDLLLTQDQRQGSVHTVS